MVIVSYVLFVVSFVFSFGGSIFQSCCLNKVPTTHPGHRTICCNWKARAASVQSFTLWQKATTEITYYDHSIFACSCHM